MPLPKKASGLLRRVERAKWKPTVWKAAKKRRELWPPAQETKLRRYRGTNGGGAEEKRGIGDDGRKGAPRRNNGGDLKASLNCRPKKKRTFMTDKFSPCISLAPEIKWRLRRPETKRGGEFEGSIGGNRWTHRSWGKCAAPMRRGHKETRKWKKNWITLFAGR